MSGDDLQGRLYLIEAERAKTHDYFAVYQPAKTKRGLCSHLCNVFARDAKHALSIARAHGLNLRKGASASRIGAHGYAAQFSGRAYL